MSKLIESLVGSTCDLQVEDGQQISGTTSYNANVLDVDDEWVKFSYTDKKGMVKIKMIRIDQIIQVNL